ncbi:MAG: metallophosphoesterase, partial [Candidatus Omnitrophota bacterium]
FIGHTHIPYLFTEGARRSSYFEEGKFVFDKKKRYIINVGSVGQPRDLDKRLSCALFDDDEYTVEIVRIAYDNKKAAGKITQAGLPQVLADRLS